MAVFASSFLGEMDSVYVSSEVICNELILGRILRYLTLRDLNKVRTVCKLWNELVEKEIKRRVLIERWFYGFVTRPPSAHFSQRRPTQTQEPNEAYIGNSFSFVSKYLKHTAINNLWSKPKNGFLFHGGFCPSSAKVTQLLEYDNFLKYMPRDCQLMIVDSSAGLISSSEHFAAPMEIQSHFMKLAAISYLFTPEFRSKYGCGITVFDENDDLSEFIPKKLGHKKLKALWIFTISQESKELKHVENIIESYEGQLAVGGAIVDKLVTVDKICSRMRMKTKKLLGVAFYGEKVKAASIVITTNTEEETKAKLLHLKKSLDFDADLYNDVVETLGFMFVCNGRGNAIYNKPNVESNLFHEVFPKVKVNGVFGYGEYGCDFLPKEGSKLTTSGDGYWYSYMTVIVLIQINKTFSVMSS